MTSGYVQTLRGRFLHGFGSIVHQVHHHPFELFAVDIDGRQVIGKIGTDLDALQAAFEDCQGILHHFVQIGGHWLRGRETREL